MARDINYISGIGFQFKPTYEKKTTLKLPKLTTNRLSTKAGVESAYKQIQATGRTLPSTLKGANQTVVDEVYKSLVGTQLPGQPAPALQKSTTGNISTSVNFNNADLLNLLVQKQLIDTGVIDMNQLNKVQQQKPGVLEKLFRAFSYIDPVQFFVGGPMNIIENTLRRTAEAKADKQITPQEALKIVGTTGFDVLTQFPLSPTLGINPFAVGRKLASTFYDVFLNDDKESLVDKQYGRLGDKFNKLLISAADYYDSVGDKVTATGIRNNAAIMNSKNIASFDLPLLGKRDVTPTGILNFGDFVGNLILPVPISILKTLKGIGLVKGNLFNKVANVGIDLKDAQVYEDDIAKLINIGGKGNTYDDLVKVATNYLRESELMTPALEDLLAAAASNEEKYRLLMNEIYRLRSLDEPSMLELIKRNYNQFISPGELAAVEGKPIKTVEDVAAQRAREAKIVLNDFITDKKLTTFRPSTIDLSEDGGQQFNRYLNEYKDIAGEVSKKDTAANALRDFLYKPSNRISEDILRNPDLVYNNTVDYTENILDDLHMSDVVQSQNIGNKLLAPIRRFQETVLRNMERSTLNRVLRPYFGDIDLKNLTPDAVNRLLGVFDEKNLKVNYFNKLQQELNIPKVRELAVNVEKSDNIKDQVLKYLKGVGQREWIEANRFAVNAIPSDIFKTNISDEELKIALQQLNSDNVLFNVMELRSKLPGLFNKFPMLKKLGKMLDELELKSQRFLDNSGAGLAEGRYIQDRLPHFLPGEAASGWKMGLAREMGPTANLAATKGTYFSTDLAAAIDFILAEKADRLAGTQSARSFFTFFQDPNSFINSKEIQEFNDFIKNRINEKYGADRLKILNGAINSLVLKTEDIKKLIKDSGLEKDFTVKKKDYLNFINYNGKMKDLTFNQVEDLMAGMIKYAKGDLGDRLTRMIQEVSGNSDLPVIDDFYKAFLYDVSISEAGIKPFYRSWVPKKYSYFYSKRYLLPKEYRQLDLPSIAQKAEEVESSMNAAATTQTTSWNFFKQAYKEGPSFNYLSKRLNDIQNQIRILEARGVNETKDIINQIGDPKSVKFLTRVYRKVLNNSISPEEALEEFRKLDFGIFTSSFGATSKEKSLLNWMKKLTEAEAGWKKNVKTVASFGNSQKIAKFLSQKGSDDQIRKIISSLYITNTEVPFRGKMIGMKNLVNNYGVSGLKQFFAPSTLPDGTRITVPSIYTLKADYIEPILKTAESTGLMDAALVKTVRNIFFDNTNFKGSQKASAFEILNHIANVQKTWLVSTFGTQFGNILGNTIATVLKTFSSQSGFKSQLVMRENAAITNYVTKHILRNMQQRGYGAINVADKKNISAGIISLFEKVGGKVAVDVTDGLASSKLSREAKDIIAVMVGSEKIRDTRLFGNSTGDISQSVLNASMHLPQEVSEKIRKLLGLSEEGELLKKLKKGQKVAGTARNQLEGLTQMGQIMDIWYMTNMARYYLKESGGNVSQAIKQMNKWFITFQALTPTEQALTSRVLLFYPWFRSNFVNTMREFITDPIYSKNVNTLFKVIDLIKTEELRQRQEELPYNSYFRNVFWIGNPTNFIMNLRSPIEASADFAKLFPFLSGSSLVDSLQAFAGNTQLPIQTAIALLANRDSRTGEIINPFNDPNIRADIEGFGRASDEWINLLSKMPVAVQKAMGFAAVENPITLETEYRIDPYINYLSSQSKSPFRLINQIANYASVIPASLTDPAKLPKELLYTITGYKIRGSQELLRITKSDELNRRANLQKMLNYYGVLSARQELYGTPIQIEKAGLPRTQASIKKAAEFRASGLNYYDYNRMKQIQKKAASLKKREEKAAQKRRKAFGETNISKLKPLKFDVTKIIK